VTAAASAGMPLPLPTNWSIGARACSYSSILKRPLSHFPPVSISPIDLGGTAFFFFSLGPQALSGLAE
jgi:hypothetical protein